MKKSPHKYKHMRKKAVRKAQSEEPIQKEISSPLFEFMKVWLSSPKSVKRNRGRARTTHRSKHTSPEEVTFQTEPEHIHFEGVKWIKNTQKKIVDATVRLSKKLMHQQGVSRKKKH